MKQFDEIGKPMPFRETNEQVDALLQNITACAIEQAPQRHRSAVVRRFAFAASAAAVVALVVSVAIHGLNSKPSAYDMVMSSQSVAEVLTQMPDDEVESEVYYTQNAISFYY
ncbi:MAG: hypothetical protein ACI4AH_00605 [Muribaculaceae bacterium]